MYNLAISTQAARDKERVRSHLRKALICLTSNRKRGVFHVGPRTNTAEAGVSEELQQISLAHFIFSFYCFNS